MFNLKTSTVSIYRSKLSLTIFIIVTIWVLFDASERFIIKSKVDSFQPVHFVSVENSLALSSDYIKLLNNVLANFVEESPETVSSNKMLSKTDEEQQSGELTKVFANGYLLELKAVISSSKNNSYDVLIAQTDLNSNITIIETFANASEVQGFKIKVITGTQVKLTRTLESRNQEIILTMYQK